MSWDGLILLGLRDRQAGYGPASFPKG